MTLIIILSITGESSGEDVAICSNLFYAVNRDEDCGNGKGLM